jgi:hypothetical protein
MQEKYAAHGGVHFQQIRSNEEINQFVRSLPSEKRDSLFEVLDELDKAGMIRLVNDGVFADGTGRLHGTEGCLEAEERID